MAVTTISPISALSAAMVSAPLDATGESGGAACSAAAGAARPAMAAPQQSNEKNRFLVGLIFIVFPLRGYAVVRPNGQLFENTSTIIRGGISSLLTHADGCSMF
ncbi:MULTISPECIES: hypothetical protein [unclassified Sphingomonas]|uniref:hypothetical protein n=1 Tax=unclassified Sphingomonas TaxID=196159 RepID=UPI00138F4603|nr:MULTISPECIES: hypothetical protein [unclassified Sphingomonas]